MVDKISHNKQFVTLSGVTISGKHCTKMTKSPLFFPAGGWLCAWRQSGTSWRSRPPSSSSSPKTSTPATSDSSSPTHSRSRRKTCHWLIQHPTLVEDFERMICPICSTISAQSTLLQGVPSARGPGLGWLRFWGFHCLLDSASAVGIIMGGFWRFSADGAGSAVCYCLSRFRVRQNFQCRTSNPMPNRLMGIWQKWLV